jgi:hypothetical protein
MFLIFPNSGHIFGADLRTAAYLVARVMRRASPTEARVIRASSIANAPLR